MHKIKSITKRVLDIFKSQRNNKLIEPVKMNLKIRLYNIYSIPNTSVSPHSTIKSKQSERENF